MKAEQFDQKFDANEDDILDDLDLSTISRPNQTQKRVNDDFTSWVIDSLDKEASRVGTTRQSIIKVWLVERLEQQAANKQIN
ncbi:type II toxin-antitoxin system BrnA family antitoxin [Colwellia echini]|uniref:CopG family transcriptional regulator n=1 Tax=Colwellia echini TaxID=1982103 RepID=A0ABY3N111_9GAMM|nr:CopG family transcriptional regulator [Colwellia echini]TYK66942.1 CopG family transcriptional regulator [Colwellia echini]